MPSALIAGAGAGIGRAAALRLAGEGWPVAALIQAMAASPGPAIRGNAVAPGWIKTGPWHNVAMNSDPHLSQAAREQLRVARVGEPDYIAATIGRRANEGAGAPPANRSSAKAA